MWKFILLALGLCSLTLPSLATEEIQPKPKAGPACELCQLVLGAAKQLLQNNATDDEVIAFIEKQLCGRLGPLNGTCVNFLETTGKQLIEDLVTLDPEAICSKIGLCVSGNSNQAKTPEIKNNNGPNSLNCTLCKLVMTQIQNLLQSNQSEAQIINFLDEKVCGILGPLKALCDTIVNQYAPVAIKLLSQKIDPEKVCEIIGLCSNQTVEEAIVERINKMHIRKISIEKKFMKSAGLTPNSLNCTLCKLVMTQIENLLQSNQSEAQIINFLDNKVCAVLGPLKSLCDAIVNQYAPIAIKLLSQKIDPEKVCEIIGMCSNSTLVLKKLNALKKEEANPIECTICQYIVQFLDNELKANKTEDAVLNALKNVCKIVPSSLKDKCDNLIDTYGVYLVQLLFEFADPLKVCQAINVC